MLEHMPNIVGTLGPTPSSTANQRLDKQKTEKATELTHLAEIKAIQGLGLDLFST